MNSSSSAPLRKPNDWTVSEPPLLRFLSACRADYSAETAGHVADYIPELGKADPDHFGISLATLDGHIYEVGDNHSA
jgi:glutaminase